MAKTVAHIGLAALAALVASLALAAPRPQRVRHPDTVAHCLIGGMHPGQAGRFEPCQNRERYGRI